MINERKNKTKLEKCNDVLTKMFPNMEDFTAQDYRDFSRRLVGQLGTEKAKQIVEETYFKLLKFLNYAVEKFANSNLKIQNFEDYISGCHLAIITKFLSKAENGDWFNNQMSFRNSVMGYVDAYFNQFYIDNTPNLIVKLTDDLIDKQATINKSGRLKKDQKEITVVQLEGLDERLADVRGDLFKIATREELKVIINKVLEKVANPEHQEIIKMFFGLDGYPQMKMKEIAKEKGIKKEDVLRILSKRIRDLRQSKYSRQLRDFLEV